MRPPTIFLLSLTALHASAFELPFQVPFFSKNTSKGESAEVYETSSTHRVAIIGAGAGGSSAAFWLGLAKLRHGLDIDIDVYDKSDYVGGRSTTVYPYDNKTLPPQELGASIFVAVNKNLWRATEEFNLTKIMFHDMPEETTGIWDGERFLFTIHSSSWLGGWWETAKMFWRYGWTSPMRTQQIVKSMVNDFLKLYKEDTPRWTSIRSLSEKLGWTSMVARSAAEYYALAGVNSLFTHEMIDAMTRVNYGQNVDELHGLEGAVSLATDGATSVEGGNFQIFEKFLEFADAKVSLNTLVKSVKRKSQSAKWTLETGSGTTKDYNSVIFATPYHTSDIRLSSPALNESTLPYHIPPQPYVHLHVTLLSTKSPHPNPAYFGLPDDAKDVPTVVLTSSASAREGGIEPEFNSLTYHGLVRGKKGTETESEEKEWAVKIFSKKRVSDEWLNRMFLGKVGWVHRKEWDAYPKLPPTDSFPSVKLDDGLYYVNAFEPFISTMETETIAARNIADYLLEEHFRTGICGPRPQKPAQSRQAPITAWDAAVALYTRLTKKESTSVYGWDC